MSYVDEISQKSIRDVMLELDSDLNSLRYRENTEESKKADRLWNVNRMAINNYYRYADQKNVQKVHAKYQKLYQKSIKENKEFLEQQSFLQQHEFYVGLLALISFSECPWTHIRKIDLNDYTSEDLYHMSVALTHVPYASLHVVAPMFVTPEIHKNLKGEENNLEKYLLCYANHLIDYITENGMEKDHMSLEEQTKYEVVSCFLNTTNSASSILMENEKDMEAVMIARYGAQAMLNTMFTMCYLLHTTEKTLEKPKQLKK